jgi:hypothetical protein
MSPAVRIPWRHPPAFERIIAVNEMAAAVALDLLVIVEEGHSRLIDFAISAGVPQGSTSSIA